MTWNEGGVLVGTDGTGGNRCAEVDSYHSRSHADRWVSCQMSKGESNLAMRLYDITASSEEVQGMMHLPNHIRLQVP